MDNANLPTRIGTGALARLQEAVDAGMAPALAIMLDDLLFTQVEKIALKMSKAQGFVPGHCIGKTEVCFAIVTRSLVWRLDPFAVAQSTYQPVEPSDRNPGGSKIAYEAKLVQAILEQSGRIDGPITRHYHGDWAKVQGKFRMQTSEKSSKKYAMASWPDEAETGLGITVSALLKGERERRTVELDLRQCHPRNSTLWATDPKTQIYYRAVRMLGNVAMPSVLMGVPFIGDDDDEDGRARRARNVTPVDTAARASAPPEEITVVDPYGEELSFSPTEFGLQLEQWCRECTDDELQGLKEYNPALDLLITSVDSALEIRAAKLAAEITQHYTLKDPAAEKDSAADAAYRAPDDDPLNLRNVKGAMTFLATLRLGLSQTDADHVQAHWACYRDRAKQADSKVNAGDYASLESLVAAKIKGSAL